MFSFGVAISLSYPKVVVLCKVHKSHKQVYRKLILRAKLEIEFEQ